MHTQENHNFAMLLTVKLVAVCFQNPTYVSGGGSSFVSLVCVRKFMIYAFKLLEFLIYHVYVPILMIMIHDIEKLNVLKIKDWYDLYFIIVKYEAKAAKSQFC